MAATLDTIESPITHPAFREFLADVTNIVSLELPVELLHRRVMDVTRRLLADHHDFLPDEFRSGDPAHYTRHLLYKDPNERFVVLSLAWEPGQGTPIHDHSTWGVMGIIDGTLDVDNYTVVDGSPLEDVCHIEHVSTYVCGRGSVVYVVPPHEEIHKLANTEADGGRRAVSLHIYGRELVEFHVFNEQTGAVRMHQVSYAC